MRNMRSGFTLIELSIVLVILALLVGGILSGQSMIANARLKKISSDATLYLAALKNFQDKYQYLPGDFPSATTVWSATTGCPGSTSVGAGNATCNGNGDGRIGAYGDGTNAESYHAWKQLFNAKLVPGPLVGDTWPAPESSVKNAYFLPMYAGSAAGHNDLFDGDYDHVFVFGAGTGTNAGPALSAESARRIDEKFDDALPALGTIRSYKKNANYGEANCTTDTSKTAAYDIAQSGNAICGLIFLTGI